MAGLYPLSRMQQFDSNGRPLSGARLFLFDGGTSTPRIGYRDSSLSTEHPNPILTDSAGRLPLIYLDTGFFRHRLTTSTGGLIFDDDGIPVVDTVEGGSGTSVDPDSVFKTRDIKIRFDDEVIDGYVRLNGRTIGSALSGATERANADTQSLYEELWPFDNISVPLGKGANAAADFAANKPLMLPDAAGRLLGGLDDMGRGQQNRITSSVLGSDPVDVGAVGGAQTVLIAQANLPSYTLTGGSGEIDGTGVTSGDGNHTHAYSGNTGDQNNSHAHTYSFRDEEATADAGGGVTGLWKGTVTVSTSNQTSNHGHAYSGTTDSNGSHAHTVTVDGTASNITISSGGSGAAMNKLPPLMLLTIYIRL